MNPERQEHEGHSIELREWKGKRELLIDGAPVRYAQLPGGLYFLDAYAFDWTDNLMELARRFIDYRRRAEKVRRDRASDRGGR